MSDAPKPGPSTASRRKLPKIKRPVTTTGVSGGLPPTSVPKLVTRTSSAGGKIYAPLKAKSSVPPCATAPASSNAPVQGGQALQTKRRNVFPGPPREAVIVMDQYERYLQNVLLNKTVENRFEMKSLAHPQSSALNFARFVAQKYFSISRSSTVQQGSLSWLKRLDVLNIAQDISILEEFAGQEALKTMNRILLDKFENIIIVGKKAEGPLFQDVELEEIRNEMEAHLKTFNDNGRASYFCARFQETLQELKIMCKDAKAEVSEGLKGNRVVLEHISLHCSEEVFENYKKEQEILNGKKESSRTNAFWETVFSERDFQLDLLESEEDSDKKDEFGSPETESSSSPEKE